MKSNVKAIHIKPNLIQAFQQAAFYPDCTNLHKNNNSIKYYFCNLKALQQLYFAKTNLLKIK